MQIAAGVFFAFLQLTDQNLLEKKWKDAIFFIMIELIAFMLSLPAFFIMMQEPISSITTQKTDSSGAKDEDNVSFIV